MTEQQPTTATPPQNGAARPAMTFKYLISNLISFMGLAGMACFGVYLIVRVAMDLLGSHGKDEGAYDGLVTYIVLPSLFTGSLLVTGLGMLVKFRRTRKTGLQAMIPGKTRTRQFASVGAAAAVTGGWLLLSLFGTYKAYEYTDSVKFCGEACHQVMIPEYTAYKESVHARVKCVECHIGPGAGWFVKSKITGMHQLWAVTTKSYKTPIKTPLHNLRPAQETCEQCHWPGRFSGSMERVVTHYAKDDDNTPTRFNLLMKVGGGQNNAKQASGIHWHINANDTVQYLPLDEKRQNIPYVRVTHKTTGETDEFVSPDFDRKQLVEANLRTMDCLDCHTRPSHVFKSPDRALNEALDHGLISAKLPGIKRLGMELLTGPAAAEGEKDAPGAYKTQAEAEKNIRAAFEKYIQEKKFDGEQKTLAEKAREEMVRIYKTNFFPEQGVDHRAFINNISHFESKGCERCHDGKHKTNDAKKVITRNCDNCHQILGEASGVEEVAKMQYKLTQFEHPEDPVNPDKTCSSCHTTNKDSQ